MLIILECRQGSSGRRSFNSEEYAMGLGDSIEKGADNAMKNLAGNADMSDDGHTPDPGNPYDDVEVHSSLSEGSNAMEKEREEEKS